MQEKTGASLEEYGQVGPLLQASKWQTCAVLLEEQEMEDLCAFLSPFWIVQVSGVIQKGTEILDVSSFLDTYHTYITALKEGNVSQQEMRQRTFFNSVWTRSLTPLYSVAVNAQNCLVKVREPVIQLQQHRFDYSQADGKIRSMGLGQSSIQWGIQFSYPQLYQDPSFQVHQVREGERFPNTALFKSLQSWMRTYTLPTPFEIEGQRLNASIRLGKQCLKWINQHPQLKAKGLSIRTL